MANTRERILLATEGLCAMKLPHRITLDMVAAEARVGKGTIYEHFSGKDDLMGKLGLGLMEKLRTELMRAGMAAEGSVLDRLIILGRTFKVYIKNHPMIFPILAFLHEIPPWLEADSFSGIQQIEAVFVSMIQSLVELGIRDGTFRNDMDARTLSFYVMGVFRASRPMMAEDEVLGEKVLRELIMNGASPPS